MREYIVKEIVNDNFNSLSPSIYLRILWTRVPKIKHKWLQIYQLSIILTILKLYLKYWNHMYNSSLLIIHNIGQDIKILNKFLEIYFSKKKKKKERIGSYSNGSRRLLFSRHVGQLRLSHTHRPPAPSATLQSFLQVNSRAAETYFRIVRSPLPPPLFLSSSLRARFKQLNCTKQLLVSLLAVFSPRWDEVASPMEITVPRLCCSREKWPRWTSRGTRNRRELLPRKLSRGGEFYEPV